MIVFGCFVAGISTFALVAGVEYLINKYKNK